jgi:bifunctional N-acetylglucosamine-1-phosphate-uridyltransferase/glucosamine-1-phosphate-acetyltransferase GlmU-like protein
VWPAEGVVVEPYVTIQAEGGLVYLDRGARLHSFVRLEAGPGETIYIGAETVVGAGCCLQGNLCVGPGCQLVGADLRGPVQIGPATTVEHAVLRGPILIGAGCEVRPGAYLRENCLFGDHVVFRSEAKNVILLDGASDRHTAAGHYAYLGDSILGRRVNLGAGTKTANLRVDNRPVGVRVGDTRYTTGRRKFGAVLGDDVQTGCLTVCDPGTLVGPRTLVYPGAYLHGTYPSDSIVKVRQMQEVVRRRDA